MKERENKPVMMVFFSLMRLAERGLTRTACPRKLSAACLIAAFLLLPGRAPAGGAVLVVSSERPEHQTLAMGFRLSFSGEFREINLEESHEKQKVTGEALAALQPDVVVVIGDFAAQMAKSYLDAIPVVYCGAVSASELTLTSGNNVGVYHEPDPLASPLPHAAVVCAVRLARIDAAVPRMNAPAPFNRAA